MNMCWNGQGTNYGIILYNELKHNILALVDKAKKNPFGSNNISLIEKNDCENSLAIKKEDKHQSIHATIN